MELPTYTNIWKIEKRLYKLYDFRLPMPLPVGQVAAFLAIAVPYALTLAVVGMPFSHTWVWLYVLPPAAIAWLVARPVMEGKRLPELAYSQLRYLSEPRTWCRMAPLAERAEVAVLAWVWHAPAPEEAACQESLGRDDAAPESVAVPEVAVGPDPPAPSRWPHAPATGRAVTVTGSRPAPVVERVLRDSPGSRADGRRDRVVVLPGGHRPGRLDQAQRYRDRARLPLARPARIVVLGCAAGVGQTLTTLLAGQLLARLRGEPVAVLDLQPWGPRSLTHQARAIVGALPGLRAGSGVDAGRLRGRGLQVVTADEPAGAAELAGELIDTVAAQYPLTIADPPPRHVPASLRAADQLVLVARASAQTAGSLAMTLEWLEANDHERIASTAVIVVTGTSASTVQHVHQAETVAAGRCSAIVQVPWDQRLQALTRPGQAAGHPGAAAVHAYTALAGVIVASLAESVSVRSTGR